MECFILMTQACACIFIGCYFNDYRKDMKLYCNSNSLGLSNTDGAYAENEIVELTTSQVLSLPVSASATLLLIYYYHDLIQYILLLLLVFVIAVTLHNLIENVMLLVATSGSDKYTSKIPTFLTALIILLWLKTGSYILNNIMACSYCIFFISFVKFPSLKLATICLFLLFLYDIYWVFFSEKYFNTNVMVNVATKQTSNIIHDFGSAINSSLFEGFVTKLELPIKLIVMRSSNRPYILGLGDIALPGLLLRLAYTTDYEFLITCGVISPIMASNSIATDSNSNVNSYIFVSNTCSNSSNCSNNDSKTSRTTTSNNNITDDLFDLEKNSNTQLSIQGHKEYILPLLASICNFRIFYAGLLGYSVGLYLAFSAHAWFQAAQPALLYIVPTTLLTMMGTANYCNLFSKLWNGPKLKSFEDVR